MIFLYLTDQRFMGVTFSQGLEKTTVLFCETVLAALPLTGKRFSRYDIYSFYMYMKQI